MFSSIESALEDLKAGKVVIVCDDENRENEGDFLALADHMTAETMNFMISHGRGLVCVPVDQKLADRLGLQAMVAHNTDSLGTAFTVSIDHRLTTTGISASERALTVKAMVNPKSQSRDFNRPGHVFPLLAKPKGVFERLGHTEAAVDLAKLAGATPAGVICEIINPDGEMARVDDLKQVAKQFDLKMITIADLVQYKKRHEKIIRRGAETQLPTDYGRFEAIGYEGLLDGREHMVLKKGDFTTAQPILVRLHSECLTGDVFGSRKCDCGHQLQQALAEIEKAGAGLVIYLRQEGRGIGLLNKLKAYHLQEAGYDTIQANEKLGFPADMREYHLAAQILQDLGIKAIKLLTNNPEKVTALEENGITVVERLALETAHQADNYQYLKTKQDQMGHLLHL